MTDFSVARYRQLVSELQEGIAARVRSEAELAAFDTAANEDTSGWDLQTTLEALEKDIQRQQSEIDERREGERRAFEERFRGETAGIDSECSRTVGFVRQRFNDDVAIVEQKHEENHWMLSSLMDDDSENSPKHQYETARHQLEDARDRLAARWEELKAIYAQATELLEQRRQRITSGHEATVAPRTRKEALEGFDAADAAIRSHLGTLKRQKVSRLFAGWFIVLLTLLLWGGLFAAGYFVIDLAALGGGEVKPLSRVLMSAGAAAAMTVLVLGVLWGIASRQTSNAFVPLHENLLVAQAHHQNWLTYAKDELRRREKDFRDRYDTMVARRDASERRFDEERERQISDLKAERDRDLAEPEHRREEVRREASERRNRDLLASEATYRRETVTLRSWFERERDRLTREHESQYAARVERRRELLAAMSEAWTRSLAALNEFADAASANSRKRFQDWNAIAESKEAPPEAIPDGIRIGDYEIDLRRLKNGVPSDANLSAAPSVVRVPAVLPFPNHPSLALKSSEEGRAAAVEILQVAMLRMLTLLPPGKVRFTVIDPLGLGENFAAFMHLADFDELLISGRIWTEPDQIERQLGNLTEHMESVFQKYLRNEFESIEEYNVHAGEVAEPYRVLVVANFPTGFTERAAQRLASIATSGPRCGVFTLTSIDTKPSLPHGFDPANLETGATLLRWQSGEFVTNAFGPEAIPLRADSPPRPAIFSSIVRKVGEQSKDVRRVEVPFRRIVPAEDQFWTADSRKGIDCPLGRSGATKLQHMRLGSGTSQHVLVAGKTGSGKSTLLHVLIANLALRYSPSEIEFYLIDFKKGVEFKTFATHELPHARVIAVESDREFGTSVLERLDALLKARGDVFREVGVQDVESFRNVRPGIPMPRILLVVDEFQEFFTEDDRYSQTASLLLDRLVRQGRAFGIHVLLGSQSLGGAYSLARTTIGQMAVRVALQCSETDAHLILSEENAAARLLTRPGEAIYNDANGMVEGNNPFQVAWLSDGEESSYLERIAALARRNGLPPVSTVVFEGNVPADPSCNQELIASLSKREEQEETLKRDAIPTAWLGESVAITGPTAVVFPPRAGTNLLLVGQDRAAVTGIFSACIAALAAGAVAPAKSESLESIFLFGADASSNGHAGRFGATIDAARSSVRRVAPERAAATIEEISAEVTRRQDAEVGSPPLFVFIEDLSRFRDLRKSDDDFGFSSFDREKPISAGKRFADVLRDGPAVGVHSIVWCDSYNNLDRGLGRQLLREFEMRVAFRMSAADSSNLIDSPAASRLGANRALLHLDDRGTTEKFRPYGPPSDAWIKQLRGEVPVKDSDEPSDELNIDEWVIS
ncbi:MAG: cell division protein FtsK [Planctomycetaceae bacterium]|nr:cell division protein FtsK [Planctomycetaceae bacterium]